MRVVKKNCVDFFPRGMLDVTVLVGNFRVLSSYVVIDPIHHLLNC